MANYRAMSGTRVDHGAKMPNPKDMRTGEDGGQSAPSKSNISGKNKENAATDNKEPREPKARSKGDS